MYLYHYHHLIGKIPASDLALLDQACGLPWEEIDYNKAQTPEAREAMRRIMSSKIAAEDAAFDRW